MPSRPTSTVAPVVVYPETDSKRASGKLKSSANMNGTAPSKLIADHMSATIKKPSRLRIACASRRNGNQSRDRQRARSQT